MKKYRTALIFEDFKLKVYLGINARERSKKQTVLVSIVIDFASPPKACRTKKLSDTICYDDLIQMIKNYCRNRKFVLIESLGMELFSLVKRFVQESGFVSKHKVYLSVAKLHPLKDLLRSVFEISD